jgi:hypothetical protein
VVSLRAQHCRRGREPERLPSEIVRADEDYFHGTSGAR